MKIFLSSTFKDLEQYRAAVIASLRRLDGVEVRCMEDFGARAGWPKEFCLKESPECDLFIGLVGHLYGFIPEGDDTSITEQEYGAAEGAGKDKLVFVAPDTLSVPVKLLRGDSDPEKQDAFRERVLSENVAGLNWSSPETLAAGVVEAVHNWRLGHGDGSAGALPARSGINVITYAQRCRRRWEAVDLSSLAAPGALDSEVESPKLSEVFIPQACRRSRPAVSLPRDYLEKQGLDPNEEERLLDELRVRWERQERLPALELLAKPEARKLVLLGDPGAGKSSLARFVLLRLLDPLTQSENPADVWRRALDGTWPILVELRDLLAREAEGRCSDLISYLAYVGETQGFGFDRAALETQLRNRPSLIIIDGLDEIFSLTRRRAVVEEIVGLESRFPDARVLITSRIAGFDARPFEAAGFTIATLDDLDSNQIGIFAEKWFDLAFPAESEKAERARNDLLDALERRPQLAVIAGNPLILTIMAIIARHKRLARSRTQLYAQALEVLSYAWDYRRGLALAADSPLTDLQPDDTLLMLRRIAWWMQESGAGVRANAIGEADLRTILGEFFEREWHFPPPKARRAASEMVKLLQERNWILTTRGPDLYGFVHRTFLEYLCALELTKRFEAQELTLDELRDNHIMPRVGDDSYSEVIRLLCGQLPVRAADHLIYAICPAPDQVGEQPNRLLLALQSLGELEPRVLANAILACELATQSLYTSVQRCDYDHRVNMASVINAVLMIEPGSWPSTPITDMDFPFSDAPSPLLSDVVNIYLGRVLWLPNESVREKLFSLSRSPRWIDRRGAMKILINGIPQRVIGVLQEKRVFDLVRRLITEVENELVRLAAIEALGTSFNRRSESYNLLWTRANQDSSEKLRAAAIRALGESFTLRPETFKMLREWATENKVETVRAAAIHALGTKASQPEILELLKRSAWSDPAENVRREAIFGCARILKSIWLRRLLTQDLDGVRPGIDPLQVIDSARVKEAAAKSSTNPDAIRRRYESLVHEHGFPLHLSWLENETGDNQPSNT